VSSRAQSNRARLLVAWLLPCLVAHLSTDDLFAKTQPLGDHVEFYERAYGAIRPSENPRVAEAVEIFEQVRAVADKSSRRLPRLTIVNSSGPPWAIALPDGHIVLSRRALDVCDALGSRSAACLAFVLGHELAHMADDDFWHKEVHGFLADRLPTPEFSAYLQQQRKIQARELAADGKGYVYAALAGYPVDQLLSNIGTGEDFFSHWLSATQTQLPGGKNQVRLRRAVIAERLETIRDKHRLFEIGFRLSHFDHCDDAIYFYEEFLKVFPGRAVLNNLGYCHLQIARQEMIPRAAYFYWMPLQLDGATRAAALTTRDTKMASYLKDAVDLSARDHLERAVEHLKQATQADPGYVPAQLNLAVAYLYLGRPHQARAATAEVLQLAPNRLDARTLDALALYEQSDAATDLWPHAEQQLTQLSAKPDAPLSVLFNLARLYAIRGRDDMVDTLWHRLAARADELPDPIRQITCAMPASQRPTACDTRSTRLGSAAPGRWPLKPTGLTNLSVEARQRLSRWDKTALDWHTEDLHGTSYRSPDDTAAVLELDGFVQLQVIRGSRLPSKNNLSASCDRALRYRRLQRGEIASCNDWAALLIGGAVAELWRITR